MLLATENSLERTASRVAGPAAAEWLSPSEHARWDRIGSHRRKSEFVNGRFALRWLLAHCCPGTAWRDWGVEWHENAPPRIGRCTSAAGGVLRARHLSLSHSGEMIAAALGAEVVGVDLEVGVKPRSWDGLADLVCTPQELGRVAALEPGARGSALEAIWTLKESWFKRERTGIDLSRIRHLQTRCVSSRGGGLLSNAQVWQGARGGRAYTMALSASAGFESVVCHMPGDVPAPAAGSTWVVGLDVPG